MSKVKWVLPVLAAPLALWVLMVLADFLDSQEAKASPDLLANRGQPDPPGFRARPGPPAPSAKREWLVNRALQGHGDLPDHLGTRDKWESLAYRDAEGRLVWRDLKAR